MRKLFSPQDVFRPRNLALMGVLVALKIILEPFSIYLTQDFKLITFSYLPGTVVAALLGPWAALAFGFVADFVGYVAKPMGPYFPGYAISEMITYFIYACLLYKREITVVRVLIARIIEVFAILLGLNFLWNVIMYGAVASGFFTGVRLINNLIQLPVHVAMTYFICRMAKAVEHKGLARS